MNDDHSLNRIANASNKFQGAFKKVLCVCSAGLLRSPTAAVVLSQPPFNFNTRACGIVPHFALIQIDKVLIEWADEIVCMDGDQAHQIRQHTDKPVISLNIGDQYPYRDPVLMKMVADRYVSQSEYTSQTEPGL